MRPTKGEISVTLASAHATACAHNRHYTPMHTRPTSHLRKRKQQRQVAVVAFALQLFRSANAFPRRLRACEQQHQPRTKNNPTAILNSTRLFQLTPSSYDRREIFVRPTKKNTTKSVLRRAWRFCEHAQWLLRCRNSSEHPALSTLGPAKKRKVDQ